MTWRAQLFQAAARKALADNHVQVGWLPSGGIVDTPQGPVHGECQPLLRRIYAPLPETAEDLAVLLHEIGHVKTYRLDATYLQNEQAANCWAVAWWRSYALPEVELAEASLQRGYEAAQRHELERDNTPVRRIEKALAA